MPTECMFNNFHVSQQFFHGATRMGLKQSHAVDPGAQRALKRTCKTLGDVVAVHPRSAGACSPSWEGGGLGCKGLKSPSPGPPLTGANLQGTCRLCPSNRVGMDQRS